LQAQRALAVAAAAIAWGTPSFSYSTLYDSTVTAKNSAKPARVLADAKASSGTYQDMGTALVDKDGKDTVLYAALKSFTKQANTWLQQQIEVSQGFSRICSLCLFACVFRSLLQVHVAAVLTERQYRALCSQSSCRQCSNGLGLGVIVSCPASALDDDHQDAAVMLAACQQRSPLQG
jgi:hypothetical protein